MITPESGTVTGLLAHGRELNSESPPSYAADQIFSQPEAAHAPMSGHVWRGRSTVHILLSRHCGMGLVSMVVKYNTL